jgi:pilus assembly protein CpaF
VTDGLFEGEEAVLHVIERIVAPLGLRVDESSPWVEARLSDGSRVQTKSLSTPFAYADPTTYKPWRLDSSTTRGVHVTVSPRNRQASPEDDSSTMGKLVCK